MINEIYQGENSIAITRFKGDYSIKLGRTLTELEKLLAEETEFFGKGYSVLIIYDGVNLASSEELIGNAIKDLRAGKEVSLNKLLE